MLPMTSLPSKNSDSVSSGRGVAASLTSPLRLTRSMICSSGVIVVPERPLHPAQERLPGSRRDLKCIEPRVAHLKAKLDVAALERGEVLVLLPADAKLERVA